MFVLVTKAKETTDPVQNRLNVNGG